MTSGAELVAFVENALEMPIHEVERTIANSPDLISRRAATVVEAMASSWMPRSLSDLQASLPDGELWPVAPLSLGDAKETALRLYRGWLQVERSQMQSTAQAVNKAQTQVQGLLLYSHGLCIGNPLHRDPGFDPSRLEEREFMLAVGEIARLAPLLEHGAISVFDAPNDEFDWLNDPELGESFKEVREQAEMLLEAMGHKAVQQTAIANVLIDRVVWQISQHAAGLIDSALPTLFFDEPLERALFEEIAALLSRAGGSGATDDEMRLRNLVDLRLPGVNSIRLKDMVHIREDEAFGIFRTDMTSALTASRDALEQGDTELARTIVREHMSSGAAKLRENTARGKISETVRADSIGWLVGAAVTASTAGLAAAAAILLAKIGLDAGFTPRSTAALKAHYVALSKGAEPNDDSGLRLRDPRSFASLAQARTAQRDLLLAQITEQLDLLNSNDPETRPDLLADCCEELYDVFGVEAARPLSWIAIHAWRRLVEGRLDSSEVDASAERLAIVAVLAAADCFGSYAALMARPALHWVMLRATSGGDTAITTEQLTSLNDLSQRWLRFYLSASLSPPSDA